MINTSSLHFYVKIKILLIIRLSHVNQRSTSSLSSFSSVFIHLLPFLFPSFSSSLTALLTLPPDDSRFALVTAPAQCPPFLPPERFCTGAARSIPVCLFQNAVVHSSVSQSDLGQDQGAGLSV